jgi:hypothetical protein
MKKIVAFMTSLILICGISIPASASGSGAMAQNQAQGQTEDQAQGQTEDQAQGQTGGQTEGTQDQVQSQTQGQTQGQTQDQSQAQEQNRQQTEVSATEREQAKLRVRDRLQISDQANTRYQDRLQQQDQTGSCFNDTNQHWAREQMNTAYCWGLINGYSDGSFKPDGNISGMGGILMVSRLMNCLTGEEDTGTEENSMDWNLVPEWARKQLQDETALSIAAQSQCYGEPKLNRLQFACMLAKAAGIEPANISADAVAFEDQSEIPAEDLGYIEALRTLGMIQGSDSCFYANRTVTRAEAAVMLTRMLEIVA